MKSFLTAIAGLASLASLASAEISYAYHENLLASQVATVDGEALNQTGSVSVAAAQLSSAIAAPGSKDLILMLSSEINLLTDTVARDSNKGGKTTAIAEAGVTAVVKYCTECDEGDAAAMAICGTADGTDGVYNAIPKDGITFASRRQELSVDVDLDCNVTNATDPLDDGTTYDCEVTGYVEVGLKLETTAAHTFNFIADLAATGTGSTNTPVRVVACFFLSAEAEGILDGGDDSEASAEGYVGLQTTMLIVQEASVSNLMS